MTFTRTNKHGKFVVTATALFAAVTGAMAIGDIARPLNQLPHFFMMGLSLLFAAVSALAFRGRQGRFVVEGHRCRWDTTVFKHRRHLLDLSLVTTRAYEEPDPESWRLVAKLRDGTTVQLPVQYLFRPRDIAEFMDYLRRTQGHIQLVGRELLPGAP